MRTLVDSALRREAEALQLRYSCLHCVHFEPDRRGCAEGYPNAAHRDAAIEDVDTLEFCKSFELL
jgi:hypothetical protein